MKHPVTAAAASVKIGPVVVVVVADDVVVVSSSRMKSHCIYWNIRSDLSPTCCPWHTMDSNPIMSSICR